MAIGSNSSCAQYTAVPRSAGRSIDVVERWPDPLQQGHDTLTGSHRICSGDLFDLCDGFLQSLAGKMGTLHPNARTRSRGLNAHVCFAVIDRRYFRIRRVHGRRRMKGRLAAARKCQWKQPKFCISSKELPESLRR
jgi:hypothetical protein